MRRILAVCICLGTLSILRAQTPSPCGTDLLRQQLLQEDPDYASREQAAEHSYLNALEHPQARNATAVVPIVVHIVHAPGTPVGTGENLSDADVIAGLGLLNAAFAGVACGTDPAGNATGIQFCLATQDSKGHPVTGITRHASTATTVYLGGWIDVILSTNATLTYPSTDYVNVWLVKEFCYFSVNGQCSGPQGLSTLAGSHGNPSDGVIIESKLWYNPADPCDGAKLSAHELGHYFNLLHTFEGGCPNNNCQVQGDRVCDTPPDQTSQPADVCTQTNSCGTDADDDIYFNPFTEDQPDPEDTYLDYSNRDCQTRFTPGQVERMNAALYGPRASLLGSIGCETPCNPVPEPEFHLPLHVLIDSALTISGTVSPAADSIVWTVDGVEAGNASTLFYTFQNVGPHTIALTEYNSNGCSRTLRRNLTVYHTNCTNTISLQPIPPLCPNGMAELIASPPGGVWSGNGFLYANPISGSSFTPGTTNTLTYSVANGNCLQSKSTTVEVSDLLFDAFLNHPIDCNNPQEATMYLLSGTGDITWTDPLGNTGFFNSFSTEYPVVNTGGTYHFLVYQNGHACEGDYHMSTVNKVDVDIQNCSTCPASGVRLCLEGAAPGSEITWTNYSGTLWGQQVSVHQPGIWRVKAVSPAGCESTDAFRVTSLQNLNPTVNAGTDFHLACFTQNYLVGSASAGGDVSIRWITTTGHVVSGGNTMNPMIDRPGFYQLEVTNNMSGCSGIDYVTVTRYVPTSHSYQTICAGESYQGFTETGDYEHTVEFARDCDSVYVLHLNVLPPVETTESVTVCAGEMYGGYSETGIYTDVFTTVDGCDSTRTLHLTVVPTPVYTYEISADGGTENGSISITLLSGTVSYLWSTGDTTAGITHLAAGIYQLTLTDAVSCTSVLTFTVPLTVGAYQPGMDMELRLSPNPAGVNRPLRMEVVSAVAPDFWKIQAYDVAGRLVVRDRKNKPGIRHEFILTFAEAGVYMVYLGDGQGRIRGIRVVCVGEE